MISFIEENPQWLDKDPDAKSGADTGLDKTPDRRAWKRVSDIVKNHLNIPAGMRTKLFWVCENKEAYNAHHGWMEKLGRVCVVELS